MYVEYYDSLQKSKIIEIKKFLNTLSIQWDSEASFSVVFRNQDGEIIATGSLSGNVLKCIGVANEHQGMGLTAKVVTELINKAHENGQQHLFVYTKPQNTKVFSALGFYEIISTDKILFMENAKDGIVNFVEGLKCPSIQGSVGSVVVNCNPFTKGHLHLIEKAAKACDLVHVFVLSAKQTYFHPDTRLKLVKDGLSHLKNVAIHSTGDYLISSATFPTYFINDKSNIENINCELDVEIFAECFAKPLGITYRFVGQEPFSELTNKYNQKMKQLLPLRGIDVVEIPRLKIAEEAVSATKVRRLIEEGKVEETKNIVPSSTYSYLMDVFKR